MLAQADAVAERLMGKILQRTIEQEERDSRALREWARKMRTATEMRPAQVFGAALVVASELAAAVVWIAGATLDVATVIFIVSVLGMLVYWVGRRREQFVLPTPDFGLLKNTWPSERIASDAALKETEAAWRARAAGKSKSWTAALLEAKSFEALRECEHQRPRAARLCLEAEPDSVAGWLASAIAAAWLGQGRETVRALSAVQRAASTRGQAICWGAAWAHMLRGNWGGPRRSSTRRSMRGRPTQPC